MAIDLFSLLSFPDSSDAFSKPLAGATSDDATSPVRKIPRLEGDSDSASASRASTVSSGAINIQISGCRPTRPMNVTPDLTILRQSIRAALTRPYPGILSSYKVVYNSCNAVVTLFGAGEALYKEFTQEIDRTLDRTASELNSSSKEGVEWIESFVAVCDWFQNQVTLLKSLLTHLNQVFIVANPHLQSIQDYAATAFLNNIFHYAPIAKRLTNSLSAWLSYERTMWMSHPSRSAIRDLVAHLTKYEQYSSFQDFYVNETHDFFLAEGEEKMKDLESGEATAFFTHADKRIQDEMARAQDILSPASWQIVRETVEKAFMGGREALVASKTLKPFIESKDIASLTKLYNLFSRVDAIKTLSGAFRVYIEENVKSIVKDPSEDDSMVPRLLTFKSTLTEILNTAFLEPKSSSSGSKLDLNFVYALTDAFTSAFKSRPTKPAEMMAKHLDSILRKGQGALTGAQYQSSLDAVLGLYRYSEDKDVFRVFYHRQLAKRLLLGRSASDEEEKGMLERLRRDYDPDFGSGLDMFKDLALSRELMREFKGKLVKDDGNGDDGEEGKLNAMVLQQGSWPFTVKDVGVDLPVEMQKELERFVRLYSQKHSGRKLTWDHALGTMTLTARFKPGTKEISVSLYQGVVLLLFNADEEIAFADVKARTRIEDAELRRTLQSLACGKKRVLKKIPMGKDINDGDIFRFNEEFTDPRPKLHINSIQAKVSADESKRTQSSIAQDRKHTLDAAIVRIMKAKKTMGLEALTMATVDAVKAHFKPRGEDVRKRILAMVDQEYLERDEKDRGVFHYLA